MFIFGAVLMVAVSKKLVKEYNSMKMRNKISSFLFEKEWLDEKI